MFTGLVETKGTIESITRRQDIFRISIRADKYSGQLRHGQSIAVSGVCLTVAGFSNDIFEVDMMPETSSRTTLGDLRPGRAVNLERALVLGSRLDGHIVTGHVDGTASLISIERGADHRILSFRADRELMGFLSPKGSVALDGISLTLIDVGDISFTVGIIPVTLKNTTLGSLSPGDNVNIETDVLAKYVVKALSFISADQRSSSGQGTQNSRITWEALNELGWK